VANPGYVECSLLRPFGGDGQFEPDNMRAIKPLQNHILVTSGKMLGLFI
jgi:hypothetical protein